MINEPFRLHGQVALVTGAGRGMGVGIARMLGQLGAQIAVNDIYPERADETVQALINEGIEEFSACADVTDYHWRVDTCLIRSSSALAKLIFLLLTRGYLLMAWVIVNF